MDHFGGWGGLCEQTLENGLISISIVRLAGKLAGKAVRLARPMAGT